MARRRNIISVLLFIFALISFICGKVYAQEGLWKFYLAEYRDVSGSNVRAIAIDSNNVVWFAGGKEINDHILKNGLSSFDGSAWIQYSIDHLFTQTPEIYSITVDKNNNKWICTNQGLVKYDNNLFTRYTSENSPLTDTAIFAAAIDDRNNIYLSAENRIIIYNNNSAQYLNIPGLRAFSIKIDKSGVLWIAGGYLGLLRYDGTNLNTYKYHIGPNSFYYVAALDINSKGEVWAAGDTGLVKFYTNTWEFHSTSFNSSAYKTKSILCHTDNNIYFTCEMGLVKFDGNNKELQLPGPGKEPEEANQLIEGKDGAIWLGTPSRGAIRILDGIWTNFSASNGLPSNSTRTAAIDNNNIKWIGTDAGLAKFDGLSWRVFNKFNSPLLSNHINIIKKDKDNSLWIGNGNKGAVKLTGSNWELFNRDNSGLCDNKINCIAIESEAVWFGTNNGLSCFNSVAWNTYDLRSLGLQYNTIRDFSIDNNGVKWIVSYENNTIISFDGVSWKQFRLGQNGWPNTSVYCCFVDRQNRKWFGCSNGIIVYDDFTVKHITKVETGIDLYDVWCIKQDKSGNMIFGLFWFKGLVIYDGLNWRSYNTANPLDPAVGISPDYFDVDNQNNKWIVSGYGGLAIFNENGIILSADKEKGVFTKDFALHQNYPNPFNGTTKIEYTIKNSGPVKIALFNVLGEEVAVIANKSVEAGTHVEYFDSNGLPSGVYFYRLTFNNFSVAKKMILLK